MVKKRSRSCPGVTTYLNTYLETHVNRWVFIVSMVVTSLALSACSVTVTEQMIVSPSTEINHDNLSLLIDQAGYSESYINTQSGERLHSLALNQNATQPTILVLHGNALNLTHQPWFGLLQTLAELPYNVLAIDYQGFGLSSGEAGFSAMRADTVNTLATLPDTSQVVVYGLSLGSVMALDISQDMRVQGVILEGAVTTDTAMIEEFRQRNTLGRFASVNVDEHISFDNTQAVATLDKPVLIIHGDNDQNIPLSMGEALYAASPMSNSVLYIVEGGGHADTFHIDNERFKQKLNAFIQALK